MAIERSRASKPGPSTTPLTIAPEAKYLLPEKPMTPIMRAIIGALKWVASLSVIIFAVYALVAALAGTTTVKATLDDKPIKLTVLYDGKKIGMTPLETRLPFAPWSSHSLKVEQPKKVQLEGLQYGELTFWTIARGVQLNAEFTSSEFMQEDSE